MEDEKAQTTPIKTNNQKSGKKQNTHRQQPAGSGLEQAVWWQPAIIMFLRLSAWIAGPVIIALFLGKWLDKKYNSAPWLFLVCTFVAFVISMLGLIKKALAEYKKIEILSKREKKTETESNLDKK